MMIKQFFNGFFFLFLSQVAYAQYKWENVSEDFGLPASLQLYKTTDSLDGKPNIAFCLVADLDDHNLYFHADTTFQRRLSPSAFYQKNKEPYVVVNTTFFSFATNQNLNAVIQNGRLTGYNIHTLPRKGNDTLTYAHAFNSAIGISKKRKADIAWLFTDSSFRKPYVAQQPYKAFVDSGAILHFKPGKKNGRWKKWKMQTAVGGGPVLIQNGEIGITNNEELKFAGKAVNDKHPRTAMGYTGDHKLVILVVEGRHTGMAEGATLIQLASLLKSRHCIEALNLDGGGSSCMLVNGKETIKPSDKEGQRKVPAVFVIGKK